MCPVCLYKHACTVFVVVFYLHSKDPVKVSRLTQQLMVNLVSFSHSPTHGLSMFLLHQATSGHVTALNSRAIIQQDYVSEEEVVAMTTFVRNPFLCASVRLRRKRRFAVLLI